MATLYSSAGKNLGPLTYSNKTGGVFGDVKCVKGGTARLTATANDILLQNVTVIPLEVATPVAVDGPDGQAGADYPVGPRPGR